MKFFEWLEVEKSRLRKLILLVVTIVWVLATVATFALSIFGISVLAIYSVVTAQFTGVVGFYMKTKVSNEPK